jgi:hypothetical protein
MTTHTGTDPYIERTDLFIDGDWQPPLSTETYTVVSPATEEPIGRVPIASAKESTARWPPPGAPSKDRCPRGPPPPLWNEPR